MLDLITKLFAFLLPIIRESLVRTVASEVANQLNKEPAQTEPTQTRGGATYDFKRPRTADEQTENERRRIESINELNREEDFHDVLLVAFDVSGRDAETVHKWLQRQMPECGEHRVGNSLYHPVVNLDSWWVANDQRFDDSDCDSAVFVPKGSQQHVRGVLRRVGLAH